MPSITAISLAVVLLLTGSALGQARQWKEAATGRTVHAELLGIERGLAVLLLPGGRRSGLDVEKLSPEDRDYLRGWAQSRSPAAQLPPVQWPAVVQQPAIHVKGGAQTDGAFVFKSQHYEFQCDAEVSVSVMNDFATVAEGTIRLLYAMPFQLPSLEGKTFPARILASRENYEKAGAPPGSAGVFISGGRVYGEGVLLVPFESLGIERFGGKNTKGYDYDATVLIHEMAHQVTAPLIPLMPRWMAEGLAEYTANIPYHGGVFQLGERERILALRQRLDFYQQLSRDGVVTGPWIMMPSKLVAMPDSEWNTARGGRDAVLTLHRLYLSSMFLTHYFLHFADNGDARRVRLYFQVLNEAAAYLASRGARGSLPPEVARRPEASLDEVRELFLRPLFKPEELPALDAAFRQRYTALGFRL